VLVQLSQFELGLVDVDVVGFDLGLALAKYVGLDAGRLELLRGLHRSFC
jgi:hypothetical protein